MQPKVRSLDGQLQLRYSFPYQIHTASVYPLSAPNGSKIIVCGHERGLLIIWRGGRPFKTPPSIFKAKVKPNGTSQELESADESEEQSSEEEDAGPAEFEAEEDEIDLAKPYQPITQHLNLPFGTAVLHVAFPKLPQLSHPSDAPLSPVLLKEKIVVTTACADSTVRLLTLPLTPPSPNSKSRRKLREDVSLCYAGRGSWGEELVTIPSAQGHQSIPRGVSVGLALRSSLKDEENDDDVEMSVENEGQPNVEEFDVLIASHSADLSGMLLIYRVPVSRTGASLDLTACDNFLWRRQPLSAPAAAVEICVPITGTEFNTPRVLVAEANGPVKIFDCVTATHRDQGSWSLSLSPGLVNNPGCIPQHRTLLDARWIYGGKAIIVLAADGEWGIWDLSHAKGTKGISGGVPSKFTYNGWIAGSSSSTALTTPNIEKAESKSGLAPMTPSTRRVRQEALFGGQTPKSSTAKAGGISVGLISRSSSAKEDDESLVIWHGEVAHLMQSLSANWQNKFKKPNDPFGSAAGGQIREISHVDLNGEQRMDVSSFPAEETSPALGSKRPDVLFVGERSLTILAAPLSEQRRAAPINVPGQSPRVPTQSTASQRALLAEGNLGIDALDQMLDGMSNGNRQEGSPSGPGKRRRVGFAT